jgi:hypothetical protein
MPGLRNHKHELMARELALGRGAIEAAKVAGYRRCRR